MNSTGLKSGTLALIILALFSLTANTAAHSADQQTDNAEPEQAEELDQKSKIRGLYAGGGLILAGIGVEDDCESFLGETTCFGEDGRNEFSSTINLGYRVNNYVAVEFGYTDYRELGFDDELVFQRNLNDFYNTDVNLDLTGTQITALLIAPGERWEAYLKAGINLIDATSVQVLQQVGSGDIVRQTIDDSGAEFLLGAGLGYSFGGFSHIRAEFNVTGIDRKLAAAGPDASSNVSAFTLEYQIRFGKYWRPQ